ncbi:MAG: SRPBCC family protein [Microbacteriaceae bacterium]|nr:SRPBCC family protein [Microbacteriaceae bacterium]
MSTNYRRMRCSPTEVFAVLADGWLYPTWVVGASRMRNVEPQWPAEGSRLHHSVGVWPLLLNDETVMLRWDAPRHLAMQPKGWPIGEARVLIDVRAHRSGSVVRIVEHPVRGPLMLLPRVIVDALLHLRNTETLRRLAYIAEGKRP